MRISLRWKILAIVLLTPATLAAVTLLTVSRNVSHHVDSSSIHESLEHAASVFESMLATRSRELAGGARVIARDPRFFSLLMLGPTQSDNRFLATVRGMARDFNEIAQSDLFEVLDRRGRVLASVGSGKTSRDARAAFLRTALKGEAVEGVLVEEQTHYQVALAPVFADGRIVGVLLLGREVGPELAREMRKMMKSEVTFVSGTRLIGTTLVVPDDRAALLRALPNLKGNQAESGRRAPVGKVRSSGGNYLTLARPLPRAVAGSDQWYVMQRAFDSETEFLSRMRRDLTILGLIGMIAAVVTALLFSEQILRPVQRLVRGAQEMEKGNYDHPLDVRSNDEIGYLANRFADMRRHERAYLGGLEQAARLKSRFLTVAAHELRTPISVLIGYHDVLVSGGLGPVTDAQKQALTTMRTHLTRLTRLAEDSARFARVKGERLELDFQPQDVRSLVREAVNTGRAAGSGRAVQVDFECGAIGGTVDADAPSLSHAIFQLVSNGIRFTPDGGRVEVRAEVQGERLLVTVRDTGVGIDPERVELLLTSGHAAGDPLNHRSAIGLEFNTPGLGLGLPVASAIVEAHGGRILAGKAEGGGSCFVIDVPLRQDSRPAAAA